MQPLHAVRAQPLARVLALGVWLALLTPDVKAQSLCSASMTDIAFGAVSPVRGQDYFASGTLTLRCTFVILVGNIIVLPNVSLCASLGPGPGATDVNTRALLSGGKRIPFNLYRSAGYAAPNVWGQQTAGMAIPGYMGSLVALGTATQSVPVYAKISGADLAAAAVDDNSSTSYSADYAAAGTVSYTFGSIVPPACTASGAQTSFAFKVSATVINDCVINTSPVAFGSQTILTGATRAVGAINVRCTSANAYRIALNGGSVTASVAARAMRNAATGETVAYALSATPDGPLWGDGSAGTMTWEGVGNGLNQAIPVYGRVPAQVTPSPGDYSDRVTATIYF